MRPIHKWNAKQEIMEQVQMRHFLSQNREDNHGELGFRKRHSSELECLDFELTIAGFY